MDLLKKLERRLGLVAVVAVSISAMLGSGIFVLPGIAATKTGSSLWLAYLAAGLCVVPAALSKAELATAMPTSGGTYVYLDRAFGPLVGTVAGLGLWIGMLLKSSFALVGFSAYLSVLAELPIRVTALALLGVIVWLNLRGVRRVSQVQMAVVAASLVGLFALSAVGIFEMDPARMAPRFPRGWTGFLATTAVLFVSYAGVTKIAAIAEEIRNPNRNLPWGMLLSIAVAGLVYTGIGLVLVGVIPPELLADADHPNLHPIYTLADVLFHSPAITIGAALLGIITMTSMANAGLLAASRFPFAMARDHLLPTQLAHLHPMYLTPAAAILVSGALMALAIMALDIVRIAKLASAVMFLMFIAVNVALIVFRESGAQWYQPGFRSPMYPAIQIFGIVTNSILLASMGPLALLAGLVILVPGIGLFVVYARRRAGRMGVLIQRGPRKELLGPGEPSTDISLHGEAAVVVALFGTERSPETLVELGHGLAEGGLLEVVHLTEVPEQTTFDEVETDPATELLERRLADLAEAKNIRMEFVALVSRDVVKTISKITSRLHCRWLIVTGGRRLPGRFTTYNPIGWLKDHLDCNLATFDDAGLHDIRKILVNVEPGPHDALVARAAEDLGNVYDARLTFARHVTPTCTPTERQSAADYLDQVRRLTERPSNARLLEGRTEAEALGNTSAGYDLMILAGEPHQNLLRRLRGTRRDRLTESIACSRLELTTPRRETHEAISRSAPVPQRDLRFLLSYLTDTCIEAKIPPARKDALFQRFARAFATELGTVEPAQITTALKERERTQNTAVGQGLAIPHATLVEADRTYLGVFTAAEPVDYEAPDGLGVDVFFVTLGAPADRHTHLLLLSGIARLVNQTDVLERLREAGSAEQILSTLEDTIAAAS